MLNIDRETTLLPPGVRVYLSPASRIKRRYLTSLFEEAEDWNFEELDLPTLDYFESISEGVSKELSSRTYRFTDDQGELLALRPDATAQVAKILSGRFSKPDLLGRYCYSCRNFRSFELRRGELREFHQFGAEILAEKRERADVELLLFMFELLEMFDHENIVLDLGHVQIYKGLIEDVDLSDRESRMLRQRIHRKNVSGLRDLLEDLELDDQRKEILSKLPTLYGGREIFDEMANLDGIPDQTRRATEHLNFVYDKIDTAEYADWVSLDFGVVRELDYYTGIVFEALLPGIGKPVVGGGRYDQLYSNYGESVPATGFALELDRLLPILDGEKEPKSTRTVWCPEPTPEARETLRELRHEHSVSVVFDRPEQSAEGSIVDEDGTISEL
jgi:ATP phosphoribosyltransferase regulatory subunit